MEEILLLDWVELHEERGPYPSGSTLQVIQVSERAVVYVLKGDDEPVTVSLADDPDIITKTAPPEEE